MKLGFSSNTNTPVYKVSDETNKLTIEEMNMFVIPCSDQRINADSE